MATCNVNTLLSDGATFQTLSERDQMIVMAQLLCDISASGGGGGGGTGSVLFGDPGGATIAGKMAYDSNGNVWVQDDPTGTAAWGKVISASDAQPPMMAELLIPAPLAINPLEFETVNRTTQNELERLRLSHNELILANENMRNRMEQLSDGLRQALLKAEQANAARSASLEVSPLQPPQAEALPLVELPKRRNRWKEVLAMVKTLMLSLFT